MKILPRKRLRRHAAPPLGPPRDPATFIDPARADHVRKVADRIATLLGRPVVCDPPRESIRIGGPHGDIYRFGTADSATWCAEVLSGGRLVDQVDAGISSESGLYMDLGVETHARGIVAAVKRYERERLNLPDRVIGTDSNGNDVYESDLEAPPSEADAVRDSRDLLLYLGDALTALGLEPDVRGDEIVFEFLGHVHRASLEDLELRRPGPSADERAMIAAGLPIG